MGKITNAEYYALNKEQHEEEFTAFKQKYGATCLHCGGNLTYHRPKESGPKYVVFFRCDNCQWGQNHSWYPKVERPYDDSEDMVYIWRSDSGQSFDGFLRVTGYEGC